MLSHHDLATLADVIELVNQSTAILHSLGETTPKITMACNLISTARMILNEEHKEHSNKRWIEFG